MIYFRVGVGWKFEHAKFGNKVWQFCKKNVRIDTSIDLQNCADGSDHPKDENFNNDSIIKYPMNL